MEQLQTLLLLHLPAGESNTVVSPTVPGGLSDGQWHTVHLRYYNKVGAVRPGVWRELGALGLRPRAELTGCTWVFSPGRTPLGALRVHLRTKWQC